MSTTSRLGVSAAVYDRQPPIVRIDTHLCAWHSRCVATVEVFYPGWSDEFPARVYGACRDAARELRRVLSRNAIAGRGAPRITRRGSTTVEEW